MSQLTHSPRESKTPTIDARIATRLAELTKQRAGRKDELDLPRTMTQREVNDYLAHTACSTGAS